MKSSVIGLVGVFLASNAKASGCKPEKILFVAGNDFFNTDTGLSWRRLCEPVAYASVKRAAVLHALVNPSWL